MEHDIAWAFVDFAFAVEEEVVLAVVAVGFEACAALVVGPWGRVVVVVAAAAVDSWHRPLIPIRSRTMEFHCVALPPLAAEGEVAFVDAVVEAWGA